MKQTKDYQLFFSIQSKISKIPFNQSFAWYNYLGCENITFFYDDDINPSLCFWGRERRIPFTNKLFLDIQGEAYSESLSDSQFTKLYSSLINLNYSAIEINSNNQYHIEYEIGIRRAGFKRPIGLFSCPLTIYVNFNEEFNFDRNWKRNLRKAIDSELIFDELESVSDEEIHKIVYIFKEMSELKKLRYLLNFDSVKKLVKSDNIRTFIVKKSQGSILSARIIFDLNGYAYDVFAANSIQARECGASYFIMDSIFNLLKSENKVLFDFGRIPPSKTASDSVYLFKNATRGKRIQYNGEWVFYKNQLLELIIFIYKMFRLKLQRY